jgi:hypothetical protein
LRNKNSSGRTHQLIREDPGNVIPTQVIIWSESWSTRSTTGVKPGIQTQTMHNFIARRVEPSIQEGRTLSDPAVRSTQPCTKWCTMLSIDPQRQHGTNIRSLRLPTMLWLVQKRLLPVNLLSGRTYVAYRR